MATDEEFLKELQQDFLAEAKFLMEQYEQYFLELDRPDCDREALLNEIFRVAHSIKGAAAATEFADLSAFAHLVEDYLTSLRSDPKSMGRADVSLLLEAGDAIKGRIEGLQQDISAPWDPKEIVGKLKSALGHDRPAPPSPSAQPARASSPAPLSKPTPESSGAESREKLKVDAERVEEVLSLVGELVILKSQLLHSRKTGTGSQSGSSLRLLDKTIRELYDKTLSMRLTSLNPLFLKSQRAVRDVSVKLAKPATFSGAGQDTQVDRSVVDSLSDPIIHLIRNAMDHGLEFPEERKAAGKPEVGTIRMKAEQRGSQVVVEVADDGRGIDRSKIIRRCLELGLVASREQGEAMHDTQLFNYIFFPGFSTAPVISDVSGRGVGLDLVKDAVDRMKGTIEILSTPGKGCIFRMKLPLTTAISDGMVVSINGYPYIIPIHVITEITAADDAGTAKVTANRKVISLRKRFIPFIELQNILAVRTCPIHKGHSPVSWMNRRTIAIVESKGIQMALSVDSIIGQSQFVMKPLSGDLTGIRGISGSAILGDGRIALVLDVDQLNPQIVPEVA